MQELSRVETTWTYTEQDFMDNLGIGSGYHMISIERHRNNIDLAYAPLYKHIIIVKAWKLPDE